MIRKISSSIEDIIIFTVFAIVSVVAFIFVPAYCLQDILRLLFGITISFVWSCVTVTGAIALVFLYMVVSSSRDEKERKMEELRKKNLSMFKVTNINDWGSK